MARGAGEEVEQVKAYRAAGGKSAGANPGAGVDAVVHTHQGSRLPGGRIPDPHRPVPAAGSQPAAVGRHRHRGHRAGAAFPYPGLIMQAC